MLNQTRLNSWLQLGHRVEGLQEIAITDPILLSPSRRLGFPPLSSSSPFRCWSVIGQRVYTLGDLAVSDVFRFPALRYRLASVSRPTCALRPLREAAPRSSRPSKHSKALFSRPDQRLTVSVRAHTLPTDAPPPRAPAGKPMRPPRNPAEEPPRSRRGIPPRNTYV